MGVFRTSTQRLWHRGEVVSPTTPHHPVSLGPGADGPLCPPARRDGGRLPSRLQCLLGPPIPSNAFYNHVAKPRLADFARTMAERLIGDMTLTVRGFAQGRACAEFRHLGRQDGSALAIQDGLREVWPGRCKVGKPAAVDLHTTRELLCDAPTTVLLPPDTTHVQACVPEPASRRARVLLAARG